MEKKIMAMIMFMNKIKNSSMVHFLVLTALIPYSFSLYTKEEFHGYKFAMEVNTEQGIIIDPGLQKFKVKVKDIKFTSEDKSDSEQKARLEKINE